MRQKEKCKPLCRSIKEDLKTGQGMMQHVTSSMWRLSIKTNHRFVLKLLVFHANSCLWKVKSSQQSSVVDDPHSAASKIINTDNSKLLRRLSRLWFDSVLFIIASPRPQWVKQTTKSSKQSPKNVARSSFPPPDSYDPAFLDRPMAQRRVPNYYRRRAFKKVRAFHNILHQRRALRVSKK